MKGHHLLHKVWVMDGVENGLPLPSGWKPFSSYRTEVPIPGKMNLFGITRPCTVILCREWVRDAD